MVFSLRSFALALSVLAGLSVVAPLTASAQDTAATPAAPAEDAIKDFSLGSPDAKVKLVEYASFTCPHCAHFHTDIFAPLKKDYIDTGKVQFTYREVYFDRYGLWAAMVARCGGEMRYFGISDILFDTQAEWAASDDPTTVIANIKKIGRAAGMDDATMDVCLQDKAQAEALVAHYQKNFAADGVEGTPTLFINGTKYANMAYEDLKKILDAELAK